MKDFYFTIFTPCYNAANTICRVFKSIEGQTYKNFEWIIINDGSTDNSDEVINNLINTSSIDRRKIIYLTQKNKGKHIAWNRAVDLAKGELFLSADADDSFLPNTLAFYNAKFNILIGEQALTDCKFSGINVCVYNPIDKKMIGTPYPYDGLISDNIELQYKYKISGEHWGIIRTDLLKKNKFPEMKGHFWTEGRIWFSFAIQDYKVCCFNECLRAYYYEPNSLVHDKKSYFNRDRVYMFLLNNIWVIKKCGLRILKYSPTGYFQLWNDVIKNIIKLCLIKIQKHN